MTQPIQPPSNSTPPRRRGAPAGNHNAVKHGFYAKKFKSAELIDIASCSSVDLQEEINMLRLTVRRVLDIGKEPASLAEAIDILRAAALAANALTRLVRTQRFLKLSNNDAQRTLDRAIEEVVNEMRLAGVHPADPIPPSDTCPYTSILDDLAQS